MSIQVYLVDKNIKQQTIFLRKETNAHGNHSIHIRRTNCFWYSSSPISKPFFFSLKKYNLCTLWCISTSIYTTMHIIILHRVQLWAYIHVCVCMNKNFERKKYRQWNLQKEKFHGFIIASDFMYGIRFVYVLVYKLSKTINKPRAIYEYNMLVLLIWWKRATILVWLLNLETEESEELNLCAL